MKRFFFLFFSLKVEAFSNDQALEQVRLYWVNHGNQAGAQGVARGPAPASARGTGMVPGTTGIANLNNAASTTAKPAAAPPVFAVPPAGRTVTTAAAAADTSARRGNSDGNGSMSYEPGAVPQHQLQQQHLQRQQKTQGHEGAAAAAAVVTAAAATLTHLGAGGDGGRGGGRDAGEGVGIEINATSRTGGGRGQPTKVAPATGGATVAEAVPGGKCEEGYRNSGEAVWREGLPMTATPNRAGLKWCRVVAGGGGGPKLSADEHDVHRNTEGGGGRRAQRGNGGGGGRAAGVGVCRDRPRRPIVNALHEIAQVGNINWTGIGN